MKKLIKKSLTQLPYIRNLTEDTTRLRHEVEKQTQRADHLQGEVGQLRKRNDEWAAEVRQLREEDKLLEVMWPVAKEDLLKVDAQEISRFGQLPANTSKIAPPYKINWVIPAGSTNDGGIINIFRFIEFLETKGHTCQVYIYDPLSVTPNLRDLLRQAFSNIKADITYGTAKMLNCDAIFATNWSTAYPVFNFKTNAKKFYFIQDYEPLFFPAGAESLFAENTYKFKLHGITAGAWLATKLKKDYGMQTDYYNFGSDAGRYNFLNSAKRQKIFFYARPVSPRRGFQLGVAALEMFHKEHPKYEIVLAGWDLKNYKLPFKFTDLKSVPLDELNKVYNECAAGLVLSFTNMSLLPLELLAAGCIPVVNDQENNRSVSDNAYIKYVEPYPQDIAKGLKEIVLKPDLPVYAAQAAASAKELSWLDAGIKVEQIITRELYG